MTSRLPDSVRQAPAALPQSQDQTLLKIQYEQLLDEALLPGTRDTSDHQLCRQDLRCLRVAGMSGAVAPAPPGDLQVA